MPVKQKTVTDKKDFEMFKAECSRWIDFIGLFDWQIEFNHDDSRTVDACGWCSASYEDGVAQIALVKEWGCVVSKARILSTARHEVLELMMWPLFQQAIARTTTAREIDTARHNIIRRMESMLDRLEGD